MQCIKINIRSVIFVILFVALYGVNHSKSNDDVKYPRQGQSHKDSVGTDCPSDIECSKLGGPCIKCSFNESCTYGSSVNVTCTAIGNCTGEKTFERSYLCRYCYQTENWEHVCVYNAKCKSISSPQEYYRTNCTVKSEVLCMGLRKFPKNVPCNWTGGYKWSTALILSITLGGFGADRFYLGHWQEGIGKLFSFGGLGVWTLIDVILISLHYLGPADGSLYI